MYDEMELMRLRHVQLEAVNVVPGRIPVRAADRNHLVMHFVDNVRVQRELEHDHVESTGGCVLSSLLMNCMNVM